MSKKNIYISGALIPPLKLGERALVLCDGELSGTAPVESIGPMTAGRALFETADGLYCLFPLTPPLATRGDAGGNAIDRRNGEAA